jgi:hypothetical protein
MLGVGRFTVTAWDKRYCRQDQSKRENTVGRFLNRNTDAIRAVMKVMIGLLLAWGGVLAWASYANRSAEKDAQAYCDGIAPGADIALEIAAFEKKIDYKKDAGGKVSVRHYGFPEEGFPAGSHDFLFQGFWYDKAYWTVQLSAGGKVLSKASSMQYD